VIPAISSAVHALGSQASIGAIGGSMPTTATGAAHATSGSSFGSELSSAIGSLDKTQTTASRAATGLADGTATDPTQAVTAVENASLAMDLASQIQSKLVTDATTLFSTQM
jgi:flagellar hook-basal body complex protein FliE